MKTLFDLYTSKQDDFANVDKMLPKNEPGKIHNNASGPLLMNPGEKYYSSKTKLLVIGQDTNEWSRHEDVDSQLNCYSEFFSDFKESSRPFWNVTMIIEEAVGNTKLSCAWTNINKFDVAGKRPTGKYAEAIQTLDPLLLEEIRILNPDICIFFTGPAFDQRLSNIFTGLKFNKVEGFEERQLCTLVDSEGVLPTKTFRTYHPRYLRMRKLEKQVIRAITKPNS